MCLLSEIVANKDSDNSIQIHYVFLYYNGVY